MLNVVLIFLLLAGILVGFSVRRQEKVLITVDRLTMWFIYLLLFSLGISVGVNQAIMSNLGKLGLQALILSSSGVVGSVLVSFLVYRRFFHEAKSE